MSDVAKTKETNASEFRYFPVQDEKELYAPFNEFFNIEVTIDCDFNTDPKSRDIRGVEKGETEYIKFKVVGQDNNEIPFRVKMTTAMDKIKKSYSERVRPPIASLRFFV